MEVKIGVTHANRELSLDSGLQPDEVEERVRAALAEGGVLTLTDQKGRRVVIPVDRLAYVEVAPGPVSPVGFRG